MLLKKEKGRPPKADRDSVKNERYQFVFSKNQEKKFGCRAVLIAFVKDAVENFNPKKSK